VLEILILAFGLLTYVCGRRSLGAGLLVLFSVGYSYGIVRANFLTNSSYFAFDAVVCSLYCAVFTMRPGPNSKQRAFSLMPWFVMLIAWPLVLFFVPTQDWAIQLVGLRAAVFFLPFLLIGARMEEKDFTTLVMGVAVLNITELGIALWEFFYGIQRFYPYNPVTQLIYRSYESTFHAYRIPATFVNSAAYGGVMAFSIPFLIEMWRKPSLGFFRKRLLELALLASAMGVFLSMSRTAFILMAFSVLGILLGLRLRALHRVGIVALISIVAWLVGLDTRLQRFTTLRNTDYVANRVHGSVNSGFFDILTQYPMGNGLGGAGTSIPYFLQERLRNPVLIENEYGRILGEEGSLGLIVWIGFIVWLLAKGWPGALREEHLGRIVMWCAVAFSFIGAPMGTGLLTSIPETVLLLLACGWLIGQRHQERPFFVTAPSLHENRQGLQVRACEFVK
jgi:hypothetical protein